MKASKTLARFSKPQKMHPASVVRGRKVFLEEEEGTGSGRTQSLGEYRVVILYFVSGSIRCLRPGQGRRPDSVGLWK